MPVLVTPYAPGAAKWRRKMREAMTLWAMFWSVVGPFSFLMWCSFAYGWW